MGDQLGGGLRGTTCHRRRSRRRHAHSADRGTRMTPRRCAHERAGFVLLAVLWVLVGLASLTLALSFAGRDAVGAAQNRMSLARAHWLAEGCVELVRGVAS